ncbi:Uncharacterised protein [Providencia alcalifaciens]|nr:Uncharacterised protein [Providencia alcalifaciens]
MPLINHSKAGYVHVNGNDDDLLQSAIKLYKDHELRLHLGNNAMTLLKSEFDVTHIARSIVNKLGNQSCYELKPDRREIIFRSKNSPRKDHTIYA